MYSQNELFRQNALGNVKTLVKEISKNPAMLRYLNGNTNVVGKPNENYGRELLELFTIGKGIEIEPGNYTNYTEDDVKAAAKVLTGWQDDKANIVGIFNQKLHDTNDKKFSSAFNNTVIKGRTGTNAGTDELNDLVEMIFAQKETARFLIRKLYHWYIFYEIDEITETNFIEPLADMLINGNYEIKPVLESMLSSAHFFESNNISVHIKNPVDFIAQTVRTFGLPVPDISKDYAAYYTLNQQLMNYSLVFQMNLFDPPDVAGWKAYYQVPDFYQLWLNTVTLPYRNGFTDQLLNIKPFNKSFIIDIIGLVQKRVSDPSDATIIVTELAEFMFILPLTQQELTYLVDNIFLPGLPLYEWTSEWNKYKQNPNDTKTKSLIISQLTQLVRFMFRMAEFQLH